MHIYIYTYFVYIYISIIYCLYVVQICITIYVCKMCMCISIASIHTSLVCSGQRATSWSWSSFSMPSQKPGFHCKHLYLMSHLAKPHLTLHRVSCSKRLLEPQNDLSIIALAKMPSAASVHHYSNLCTFSMPSKK